jgi:hypothetical protein
MSDVLILGPQYRTPTLRQALAGAGLHGPIATITAGWQEREGELGPLEEHLGQRVRDLRLYERAEGLFGRDPALHEAHRQRQADLRQLQEIYRARLDHAKAAARELLARPDESEIVRWARRDAVAALRRLDATHLRMIERVHERFMARWSAALRPLVAQQEAEIKHLIDESEAVCIAGGHVAVLLNRLRLFGLRGLLRSKPLVAWSAGAMALTERVILFHDHPPQGAGNAEVFEAGLGLIERTVLLPHAATRLALNDSARVALFARRFSPAACRTLDDGSLLHWRRGRLRTVAASSRLLRTGRIATTEVAHE